MPGNDPRSSGQRSFPSTMVAVVWSFVGLRRRKDFDRDVGGLNPFYVVTGGVLGAAMLVAALLAVVHMVVPSLS